MHSAVTTRRDAGTYYTVDKGRFDALLKTMPAAQGILMFLELKRNYTRDGATFGELADVLGRSAGTVENTLYKLMAAGQVERRDGRFFPPRFHNSVEEPVEVSTTSSTGSSTTLTTELWKTGPSFTVLDVPPEPLKERKEKNKKKKDIDPPTPQEKKTGGGVFDPAGLELPDHLDPQVWARWCRHRGEIKKPLTPTTTEQQLALLSKTPGDANAIITQSIERGWAGLFPLKHERGTRRFSGRGAADGASDPVADKRRRDAEEWERMGVTAHDENAPGDG